MSRRFVIVVATGLLVAAFVRGAAAQCLPTGGCDAELFESPKAVEKYVKKAWAGVSKCAKRSLPTCPDACPLPDATAEPFLLSPSCRDYLVCQLDVLAEAAYGSTWDDVGFCALSVADDCGIARAKGGGKFVNAKLKRRRTSKVDKLPKDEAKCIARIDKAGACDGASVCPAVASWVDDAARTRLRRRGYQAPAFEAASAGQAWATLTLSAESADWGVRDAESVVLAVDLDGNPVGNVVVHSQLAAQYRILLGEVEPGRHQIGLRHDKKASPAKKSDVIIEGLADATVLTASDPAYDAYRVAPLLRGIDTELNPIGNHRGNAVSDLPTVTYVRAVPGAGKTTYRYTMIWSNEDGGTGLFPEALISQWGRYTDIETYVEVDVLDDGSIDQVRHRPDESGSLSVFVGDFFDGTHPIVRTSTANGLVADDGDSTLLFALAPFEFDDSAAPREQGMDLDPFCHRISALEGEREGKLEPFPNPGTRKPGDLRTFLFLDYDIDVDVGGYALTGFAVVGGTTYRADHFAPSGGSIGNLFPDGRGRTGVELPAGTTIGDVESYGILGIGTMTGTLYSLRGFMLDEDYFPDPVELSYTGPLVAGGPAPAWTVIP